MIRRFLAVCAVVCSSASFIAIQKHAVNAAHPPESPADLVLTNGEIYTVDAKRPWATAVAIRGETIVAAVDSEAALKSWIGPHTRVVDLHGQFAMPGFNDAHVHLAEAAYGRLAVNL